MNLNLPDSSDPSTGLQTRAILDALHHAVVLLDAAGGIRWLNSAALQLYGRSETECVGVPVTECPAFNYSFRNEILRVLHTSGRWEGESERVRSDGTVVGIRHRRQNQSRG
jgi:PAS domain S-box-containing protein